MKLAFLTSACLLFALSSYGQDDKDKFLSFSGGAGVFTFNGDIGKGKQVSAYTYIRGGFSFNVEKRFNDEWFGASLNYTTGKLAMGERSVLVDRNNNFESKMHQFGINAIGYLRNKNELPVYPYATVGIAFSTLKAYSDLFYGSNKPYYYWDDGSIRDLPQVPGNEFSAHHVTRDYIYETRIDSADKSVLSLPVGGGIKLELTPRIEANIGVQYHFSFKDGIDGFKSSGNDKYLYSYFSLTYSIFNLPNSIKSSANFDVDYAALDKSDEDGDGVSDMIDECLGTEKGAKVDSKGCALDSDNDGIPDHRDKEPNTPAGSVVDADGRVLTDAAIKEQAKKDSIYSSKAAFFKTVTNTAALEKFDQEVKQKKTSQSTSKVPEKFVGADKNKDGIISSSEVTAVIDGFFDGTNNYTVEKIHDLIEYFFDQ